MQKFNIYKINEVKVQTQRFLFLHNWINKLLSEKIRSSEHVPSFYTFITGYRNGSWYIFPT